MPENATSQQAKKKVVILGGGVAGLSAAHELLERGFSVEIYERKKIPGGKARSVKVPGSANGDMEPLPGEHGFRFFPGFYFHLDDTMKRIPTGDGKTVSDNLASTGEVEIFRHGKPSISIPVDLPNTLSEIHSKFSRAFKVSGLKPNDLFHFYKKLFWFKTSCLERQRSEFEDMSWWEFVQPDGRGSDYCELLAVGLTQVLVAARPREMSARTGASMLTLVLSDIINPDRSGARVLKGPTNEVWIEPWLQYLHSFNDVGSQRFVYHFNCKASEILFDEKEYKITGVKIEKPSGEPAIIATGDCYIFALPVECMDELLDKAPEIAKAAGLESINDLALNNLDWMNGIQFYLKECFTETRGHGSFPGSRWALTSISQGQYWVKKLNRYGDGTIKDILSVDISDWNSEGHLTTTEPAKKLTKKHDIACEVWAQLKHHFTEPNGRQLLTDNHLHCVAFEVNGCWFLDPSIVITKTETNYDDTFQAVKQLRFSQKFYEKHQESKEHEEKHQINWEPLLINKKGSWNQRPKAVTKISNMFLASDYVQTNTDLACMEGANEAARRAVNAILKATGSKQKECPIWDVKDDAYFRVFREYDRKRFSDKKAYSGYFPPWVWMLFIFKLGWGAAKLFFTGKISLWGDFKILLGRILRFLKIPGKKIRLSLLNRWRKKP